MLMRSEAGEHVQLLDATENVLAGTALQRSHIGGEAPEDTVDAEVEMSSWAD